MAPKRDLHADAMFWSLCEAHRHLRGRSHAYKISYLSWSKSTAKSTNISVLCHGQRVLQRVLTYVFVTDKEYCKEYWLVLQYRCTEISSLSWRSTRAGTAMRLQALMNTKGQP